MEGEWEGEKHQCVVASHVPPTGDLACTLGMCPDWELNQWLFGLQVGTQSTEPHQPGLFVHFWKISFLFLFKRFYLFIFRERGMEGEREGEKQHCVVASHVAPTGDPACNPGMCPNWELNWWPFGSQASAQSTEPPQPGSIGLH